MNPKLQILAATDFSPAAGLALDRAAQLAAELGAGLTLTHAFGVPQWFDGSFGSAPPPFDLPALRVATEEALRAEGQRIDPDQRLAIHHEVLQAPLPVALAELCRGRPFDLLVIGAQGRSHWQRLLLGSTADRLLRHSGIPTLLVREAVAGPWQRVILGTDLSPAAENAARFGLRLTPRATHLLAHADERLQEPGLLFAHGAADAIDAYRRELALGAMQQLEALASRLGESARTAVPVLREGPPLRVLCELVEETGAGLVVLGAHGRSELESRLLGSLSHQAANALTCDVLVVPPRPTTGD